MKACWFVVSPFYLSLVLVNILLQEIPGIEPIRVALLSIRWEPGFLLLSAGLLLLVSLMPDGYLSIVTVRLKSTDAFKGKAGGQQKKGLRSSLIVLQFIIACVMISVTWIIYRQFQFLQAADLGFDKTISSASS